MWNDPIIEEIHKIRQAHAEKFGYDLRRIFEDLKELEVKSGRTFVSLSIRRKVVGHDCKAERQ